MADLRASGVNPLLALGAGGASTPSGSTASSSNPGSAQASAGMASSGIASPTPFPGVSAGMATAAQIRLNDAATERTTAEAEKTRAEKLEIEARTPTYAVSMDQARQNIERSKQEILESTERIKKILQETATSEATATNIAQQTTNLKAELPRIEATIQQLKGILQLNDAQRIQALSAAGLSTDQAREVTQRIKANLPEMERQAIGIKNILGETQLPQAFIQQRAQESLVGRIGTYLRALNPIAGLLHLAK